MKKVLFILSGTVLLLIGALTFRTIRFVSRQIEVPPEKMIRLDTQSIVGRLARAIQYRTISGQDTPNSTSGEFQSFHRFLDESFPGVNKHLSKETVGRYSLLYTWKGADERLKPILLMGHMDVVPVDPKSQRSWTYPAFSGRVADGYVWGRGAMDDKVSVLGILEAVEHLLAEGFTPRRTVYLAFGHDEEIGGQNGAAKIAALLASRKVELEWVLDEGGNVTDGIIPGVSRPVALVGIAEKGYLTLELAVESIGGHSSIPPARTAIGILSSAIHKLEQTPFPTRLSEPTRRFFEFIGPELGWTKKMALANLWLFEPFVKRELEKSPLTVAMIRTTQAATIFQAGIKENVLPNNARAVVNFRLLPGDTIASVVERVRKIIDDPRVTVALLPVQMEPSATSDSESKAFSLLQRVIWQTIGAPIVAPSLLVAATDSRHYAQLTKNVFRFLPITLRAEDANRYHGIDERIAVKDYEQCIRFYDKLIADSNL